MLGPQQTAAQRGLGIGAVSLLTGGDSMQVRAAAEHEAGNGRADDRRAGWPSAILRNALAVVVAGGTWLAIETGYFSNDRTPRVLWEKMERLKSKPKGEIVYEASWQPDIFANRDKTTGYWDYYNGATKDTAALTADGLQVRYTAPWIGAYFMHRAFEPNTIYRVVLEAKVEDQPAAILMRNRQLDLLREEIPVTGGEFKEFTTHYVSSGGRYDQVRLIFMPNLRRNVKGRITIRKLRIEKLNG